ncbi:hypothetical protein ASZ90_017878 [hydrocarbon metagenome]|uniref:Uncharacterized protein n=1 Tax=hydrocarbon metagenome TaxID=938273 RepID=A0A0W8E8G0_9ZZZZ
MHYCKAMQREMQFCTVIIRKFIRRELNQPKYHNSYGLGKKLK